jgi:hypothetical protein
VENQKYLHAVAKSFEVKAIYLKNPQFETIVPVPAKASIDDRLKFARLLQILGTPTWPGGAK